MKLSQWVAETGGRPAVAARLGVSRQTLHYWIAGSSIPRIETLEKIERLSKGSLTVAGMIAEIRAKRKRSRR